MTSVLFDLYGTLIDIQTDESSLSFWQKFAKKMHKYKVFDALLLQQSYEKTCLKFAQTKEEIEILDVFSSLFDVNKIEAIKIANQFRKISTKYLKLYPGVKQLLKQCLKNGYALYIVSNAQSVFTLNELKKLKIYNYFEGIAISSEYGVKKPNKDFFLRAIQNYNLTGDVWMIGNDYECDIQPAKALGLKTIFIESNLTPENQCQEKLIGLNAQEILNQLSTSTLY